MSSHQISRLVVYSLRLGDLVVQLRVRNRLEVVRPSGPPVAIPERPDRVTERSEARLPDRPSEDIA